MLVCGILPFWYLVCRANAGVEMLQMRHMENTLQLVALLRVLFLFPGPMTAVHSHSGPARLERFYDLFISEVSLFSWNELPTELERPKRYVPDGLSQVPRRMDSNPTMVATARGGAPKPKSSQPRPAMRPEIEQGTGNAKSANQQEEWDWRSWKKPKKGKEEIQEEHVILR